MFDDDSSGFLSAGEFGRFMRKGEGTRLAARTARHWQARLAHPAAHLFCRRCGTALAELHRAQHALQRLQRVREAHDPPGKEEQRVAIASPLRKTEHAQLKLSAELAAVAPADEAEVKRLAMLFNAQMASHAATRSLGWFKFFNVLPRFPGHPPARPGPPTHLHARTPTFPPTRLPACPLASPPVLPHPPAPPAPLRSTPPHPALTRRHRVPQRVDYKGSGRVLYADLSQALREVLRLGKEQLPEPKLHALWRALDETGCGSISCAAWLPFVKRGAAALQAAESAHTQSLLRAESRRQARVEEVEQYKAASRKAEAATRAIAKQTRKLEALLTSKSKALPRLEGSPTRTSFVTQGGM